jgi:serine protease Do
MASALSEFSDQVTGVVATASPSVVGVGRAGSGVIVANGLVVTNAHNLRDEVVVSFADGTAATATVAGVDIDGDLAVIAVETGDRPALAWGPAATAPALGQVVIGLSRPGGRALRAGVGFVSALGVAFRGPEGSTVTGALEHSAPLARGSSGGPVVDAEGRLVGINTHREGEGFYLALPATSELKDRVDALARGDAPRRVRLGVALTPPRAARRLRHAVGLPPRDGLLVHAVDGQGPAARAGIRGGDLIVSVDGRPVASVEDLAHALQSAGETGSAELVVVRGVEEVTISVDFGLAGPSEQGTA